MLFAIRKVFSNFLEEEPPPFIRGRSGALFIRRSPGFRYWRRVMITTLRVSHGSFTNKILFPSVSSPRHDWERDSPILWSLGRIGPDPSTNAIVCLTRRIAELIEACPVFLARFIWLWLPWWWKPCCLPSPLHERVARRGEDCVGDWSKRLLTYFCALCTESRHKFCCRRNGPWKTWIILSGTSFSTWLNPLDKWLPTRTATHDHDSRGNRFTTSSHDLLLHHHQNDTFYQIYSMMAGNRDPVCEREDYGIRLLYIHHHQLIPKGDKIIMSE